MVEFALIAALFFLVVVGVVQFGLTFFTIAAVNNAAREGARYGAVHPDKDDATKADSIQAYVKRRASGGVNPQNLTVEVTFPPTTELDDQGRIVTEPNNRRRGDKIKVEVGYPMFSLLPGLPNFQITKTSTMRIEVDQ